MKDPTDSKETELRRRDVLKHGAAVTGTLVVGGTAVSGTAAAKGKENGKNDGGMTAITWEGSHNPEDPFTIDSESLDGDLPASCLAPNSEDKEVQQFFVKHVNKDWTAFIVVREERADVLRDAIGTDEKFEWTPNAVECDEDTLAIPVVRGTIKPVK